MVESAASFGPRAGPESGSLAARNSKRLCLQRTHLRQEFTVGPSLGEPLNQQFHGFHR